MPSTARALGVSYSRFSDPKQADGDSQKRQDEMFREFCTRHNLTPSGEAYRDKGKSGYHDQHRKRGRLGVLVAAAKDGAFEPGTVIVVEAWDRLGRLRPDKQIDLLAELLRTGVAIGICRLNDTFREDDFGTHKWTVLATFVQLAFQESKQKAERVAHSWKSRREKARQDGTPVTGQIPFWLEMTTDGFRPIPERAAAIKAIFGMAARGLGRQRMLAALEKDEVRPFGTSGRWTRSYLGKILSDERVLGAYQPRNTADEPAGDAIAAYYPPVVSDDEWTLARAGMEGRQGKDRKGRDIVRPERKHLNLFRSMLTDATGGGGYFLQVKSDRSGGRLVLRDQADHTFPYLVFEEAVLRLFREINPADVLPKKGNGPSAVEVLKARLENIRKDMAALKTSLTEKYSKAIDGALRAKEAEEEAVGTRLQEEKAKAVAPAERAWKDLPSLADLMAKEGDAGRLRLRPVLRRVVEDARLLIVRRGSYLLCAVQFFFTEGGANRSWLIINQAAGYNRRGRMSAQSLPPELATALDLRKSDHARRLEKQLLAVGPAALAEPDGR